MFMKEKKKKRQISFKVEEEIYTAYEEICNMRQLGKKNCFVYLVNNHKQDLQTKRAAEALNKISEAAIHIIEGCDDKIKPFVVAVKPIQI